MLILLHVHRRPVGFDPSMIQEPPRSNATDAIPFSDAFLVSSVPTILAIQSCCLWYHHGWKQPPAYTHRHDLGIDLFVAAKYRQTRPVSSTRDLFADAVSDLSSAFCSAGSVIYLPAVLLCLAAQYFIAVTNTFPLYGSGLEASDLGRHLTEQLTI